MAMLFAASRFAYASGYARSIEARVSIAYGIGYVFGNFGMRLLTLVNAVLLLARVKPF